MQAKKLNNISIKEYIAIEKANDVKYEYLDGSIYAMAGGTVKHTTICGNVFFEIETALRGANKPCRTYNTDAKIRIESKNSYVYPDATVVCGEPEMSEHKPDAVTNPTVIVEVLSKSTVGYDRGDKFYLYRQIESLQEYILIEQEEAKIEIYKRKGDLWHISRVTGLEAELFISSLDVSIELKQIYLNVDFAVVG